MITPHIHLLTRQKIKSYNDVAGKLRRVVMFEIDKYSTNSKLEISNSINNCGKIKMLDYCGDLVVYKLAFAYTNLFIAENTIETGINITDRNKLINT